MYIYCISSTKLYTFSNIVVNTEEINNTHLLQVAGLAACLCRPRQDAPPPQSRVSRTGTVQRYSAVQPLRSLRYSSLLLHRTGSAGQVQSRNTQRYSHSALSGTAAYSSIEGHQDRDSPEILSGTATPISQVHQLLHSHRYSDSTLPGTPAYYSLTGTAPLHSLVQHLHSPWYRSIFHSHRYSHSTLLGTPAYSTLTGTPATSLPQVLRLHSPRYSSLFHSHRYSSLFHSHRYNHSTILGTPAYSTLTDTATPLSPVHKRSSLSQLVQQPLHQPSLFHSNRFCSLFHSHMYSRHSTLPVYSTLTGTTVYSTFTSTAAVTSHMYSSLFQVLCALTSMYISLFACHSYNRLFHSPKLLHSPRYRIYSTLIDTPGLQTLSQINTTASVLSQGYRFSLFLFVTFHLWGLLLIGYVYFRVCRLLSLSPMGFVAVYKMGYLLWTRA